MPERTCPNCGKPTDNANYCPECGEPLMEPLPEDTASEETVPEKPEEELAEASEASEAAEPAEAPLPPPPPPVAEGAELSGADLPAGQPPTGAEPFAPEAPEEPEPAVTPGTVEPRGPHHEPVVAGATPMQQAAEDARAPAPPIDGQLRCPTCGEAVYASDRVCWNCSRRLEVPEAPAAVEPAGAAPAAAAGPESGAPAPRQVPPGASQATASQPVSPAARPQEPISRTASDEAMAYAWWSLGLGLLSVFTCGILGLLGIASLWLGISAARRNAGPVAIAGAVFGAIGLIMLLAWVVGLAIAMPEMMHTRPTHIIVPTFR